MLTLTAAAMIVLVLTTVAMRTGKSDPAQLTEPRVPVTLVGIQIICGDCAGDEVRPKRTYLDLFGNCSQCGGHSFVLASNVAANLMKARQSEFENVRPTNKVLPFSPALVRKIAV
jgi:hypothetical protein